MKEFEKYIGYCFYAFGICMVMEITKIFVNLGSGESAFYLFDLSYLFSPDNNLFLMYWAGAIGAFGSAWLEVTETKKTNDSKPTKQREQEQANEWFDKIESSDKHGWKMSWVDPKTGTVKSHEEYRSGYIPHNSWYVANSLSPNDVERLMSLKGMKNFDGVYGHPTRFVSEYKDWKEKSKVQENTVKKGRKFITKDVTRTPKSEISLSALDFFRHHHYNQFEASHGIDLKSSRLEIIEIYELYKAYLLLNHNIKVKDPNE